MIFHKTPLEGAFLIEMEKRGDDRDFFAKFYCTNELQQNNLEGTFVQVNNSFSSQKGTLRGMHYQLSPKEEVKIVRCIMGSFYDVIVDLRLGSKTFGQWYGHELSAKNRLMMYVPKGFAHGFTTLEDDTEALYLVSEVYDPTLERGFRWNDPKFLINWPLKPMVISDKDRNHKDFDFEYHLNKQPAGVA